MTPEADLELEEHHRAVRRLESKIDSLLREKEYASLEDAYWDISRQALAARRRLRRITSERV